MILTHWSLTLILSRFVDRDMFMRFFGAGIGHKATYKYTGAFRKDVLAMASVTELNPDTFVNHLGIPREEDLLAEEQDYGYEIGSGSEDEEGLDEHEFDAADLGAEDGEEPWDEDDLHAEGYDEL
jgi:hypothetical protein